MASSLRTKLRIASTVLGARGFWDALAGRFLWQPSPPAPSSRISLVPRAEEGDRSEPSSSEPASDTGKRVAEARDERRRGDGRVLRGALHVHTCTYSDGAGTIEEVMAAAKAAGVDFVLLTDHNTMRPKADGLEERYAGHTPFLIVGDELTVDEGAFVLALDLPGDFEFPPNEPHQAAIDAVLAAGGLPLVSLPDDMKHPWEAWDATGCEGLEALNLSTVAREHINIPSLLWLLPLWFLKGELAVIRALCTRPDASLASWDRLLAQGKRQIGLGALDAHALMKIGKKKHPIPSYENSFRAVTTHILFDSPIIGGQGVGEGAISAVHDAIRAGRCYFAYDCLGEIALSFTADDGTPMGSETALGATLTAQGPESALLRLYHNGKIVAAGKGSLTFRPENAGAYRLEAYRVGAQRGPLFLNARPWAFTNPIYLTIPPIIGG